MIAIGAMIAGVALISLWTWVPIKPRSEPRPTSSLYSYDVSWKVRGVTFGLLLFFLGLTGALGRSEFGKAVAYFTFVVLPVLLALLGLLTLVSKKVNVFMWRIFRPGTSPVLDQKWLGIWLLVVGVIWFSIFTYLRI